MKFKPENVRTSVSKTDGTNGKESVVVGVAKIPLFLVEGVTAQDALDEMIKVSESGTIPEFTGGLTKIIQLAQTQLGTNIKNNIRSEFAGEPSDGKLREEALSELGKSDDLNLIRETLTDPVKREAYLDKTVEKVKNEWAARRDARIREVAAQIKAEGGEVGEEESETVPA